MSESDRETKEKDDMNREQELMISNDEMYREIQKLREIIHKFKEYGEKLIEVKVDPWWPESNRSDVSHEVGCEILKIIRDGSRIETKKGSEV